MWTDLVMLFRNEEVELKDFVSIFKAFVADIPLSLPPIKVDCLVVNDFDNSYVDSCEYMYIIGANDSELPKYSVETALLSDKEIQKIERHNKITPTINLLNKRKKFKLYEMVLKSRHNITFSYVCVDAKGEEVYPTTIYTEIAKYIKPYVYVVDNAYVLDSDANELITYNITKSLAMDKVVKYLKDWELFNDDQVYRRNVTSIQHSLSGEDDIDIIGNANYDNVAMPVAKANKLFFRNDEVSPSQFEKFASCPYAHFMNYGLRLKEQERAKVSTNDIGNIIHEYLNNVIYDLSNLKNDEEFLTALEDFARKSLDKVLDNKRYARFVNANINSIVIKSLYNEVIRMTKAIIEQLRNCDYEPTYKEYVLNVKNGGYIAISLRNGKRLNVVGKVDRIDTNKKDNSFIVIDYKTGNSNFANFTDFVSGKKIQLFTYLLMFKNMTGATPVGSFYLPIDNKVNDAKKYRYNGFFVKNIETVGNIDNKLRDFSSNGEILRLSRTKDGEFSQKSDVWKNLAISSKAIENSFDFLTDALTCRAEKIMEGNIDLVPLLTGNDSASKYCKFKGLCNFNTKYGNKYRRVEKVASLKEIIDVNESYESVEEEEDV